MIALVFSGEAIFFLPFILPRVFRPTMLEVFDITNFELGAMFSAYGIVAMGSYFLGGPLADRYSARNLMSSALIATSLGGLMMAVIPPVTTMTVIYAFWGMTTILLFWAALIRATREWGESDKQGKAFGLLEGGRGLSGALIATIGLTLMSYLLPSDLSSSSLADRTSSFQLVILLFSAFTFLIAILVWFSIPGGTIKGTHTFKSDLAGLKQILKMRVVWLQGIIIVCGYVGYKITDDFSLYAQDVLGFDQVDAAGVGTTGLWIRPIVAVMAGFTADRVRSSRLLVISFVLLLAGAVVTGLGILEPGMLILYGITFLTVATGVYSIRTLFFAIMEEAKIPLALTGTAVGVASVVGYTPDIFVGPMMGWLLDRSPGATGHEHLFLALAAFALIGLLASIAFTREIKKVSQP